MFGRVAIYQDNRIEEINFLNKVSDTYTANDFSHLTIRAKYDYGGRHERGYWEYSIIIEMKDGTTISFDNRDFGSVGSEREDKCLDKMLEIKSLFPADSITIKGAKYLDRVSNEWRLNDQQIAKLKLLFSE